MQTDDQQAIILYDPSNTSAKPNVSNLATDSANLTALTTNGTAIVPYDTNPDAVMTHASEATNVPDQSNALTTTPTNLNSKLYVLSTIAEFLLHNLKKFKFDWARPVTLLNNYTYLLPLSDQSNPPKYKFFECQDRTPVKKCFHKANHANLKTSLPRHLKAYSDYDTLKDAVDTEILPVLFPNIMNLLLWRRVYLKASVLPNFRSFTPWSVFHNPVTPRGLLHLLAIPYATFSFVAPGLTYLCSSIRVTFQALEI